MVASWSLYLAILISVLLHIVVSSDVDALAATVTRVNDEDKITTTLLNDDENESEEMDNGDDESEASKHSLRHEIDVANSEVTMTSSSITYKVNKDIIQERKLETLNGKGNNNNNDDDGDEITYFAFTDNSDPLTGAIIMKDTDEDEDIDLYSRHGKKKSKRHGQKKDNNKNSKNKNEKGPNKVMKVARVDSDIEGKRKLKPSKKIVVKRNKNKNRNLAENDGAPNNKTKAALIDVNEYDYPYSSIGVLVFTDCEGTLRVCTASLVGADNVIVTASHCIANCDKGKICSNFWQSATFYAGYIPQTRDSPAMWRGVSYLESVSYWVDTKTNPDIAVATLTSSVKNVGYLGAIKVFGDFFDINQKPNQYSCPNSDGNLCLYSSHSIVSSGYSYDSLVQSVYEYYGDGLGQQEQMCKTVGMDYNCYFPRVLTTCTGYMGGSGSPLIIDTCGTKPKNASCMNIVGIYKGRWCSRYVATATGYAWKAIKTHVDLYRIETKAPTLNPTRPTNAPTPASSTVSSCTCDTRRIKNGKCDPSCYNSHCSFDGGDCDRLPLCLNSYCSTFKTADSCQTRPVTERLCSCRFIQPGRCSGV